jgi:hypothetical protein
LVATPGELVFQIAAVQFWPLACTLVVVRLSARAVILEVTNANRQIEERTEGRLNI